jgi:hypothetical protein
MIKKTFEVVRLGRASEMGEAASSLRVADYFAMRKVAESTRNQGLRADWLEAADPALSAGY